MRMGHGEARTAVLPAAFPSAGLPHCRPRVQCGSVIARRGTNLSVRISAHYCQLLGARRREALTGEAARAP